MRLNSCESSYEKPFPHFLVLVLSETVLVLERMTRLIQRTESVTEGFNGVQIPQC